MNIGFPLGRAGRARSSWESGLVTCLNEDDMPALRAALVADVPKCHASGLFPQFEQIEFFAQNFQNAESVIHRSFPPTITAGTALNHEVN
jgi:hypothetical protein